MSISVPEYHNSPIFIVGTPRSGTTLMANILGSHSALFIEGELHFFDDIYSKRKKLGNPTDPAAFDAIYNQLLSHYGRYNFLNDQRRVERIFTLNSVKKRLQCECKSYRDILSCFMNIQAYESGKRRWGNQVPRDLFNVNLILQYYPHAKIIVCVRDIRDFLLSYKNKWRNTSLKNVKRLKSMYHPIVTSFLWKLSVRRIAGIKRKLNKSGFTIVRYETLVNKPERTIREVCKFIGERFEYKMLDIDSENSSFDRQKGIFRTSVGHWQSALSPEEAFLSQCIGGKDLKVLGYSKAKIIFNPIKIITMIMSTPFALIRILRTNAALRGPLLPYLKNRLPFF